MYTEIKTKEGSVVKFTSKQYEVGTYLIINDDPNMQTNNPLQEDKLHIKIRKQAIKNGDTIINGTYIPFKGKININPFSNDIIQ